MRIVILLFIALVGNFSVCMQTDFVGPEELLSYIPQMPEELSIAVQSFCDTNPDVPRYPATLTLPSFDTNKSTNNIVFQIDRGVIKLAGRSNVKNEVISSLGYDPYGPEIKKEEFAHISEEIIKETRRFQAVSALAYWRLLEKLEHKVVHCPATYAYHIKEKPKDLDDKNYLVIQALLPPSVVAIADLPLLEYDHVIDNLNLDALYATLKKCGLWNLHKQNLLVNKDNLELWVSDLEKPNNEGFGEKAKWKIAVFGKGCLSDDPSKWRHNIRAGHKEVVTILQSFPEKQKFWEALLIGDPEVQN